MKEQQPKQDHGDKTPGQLLYDALASRVTRWEKLSKNAQALYEARASKKK